MQQVGRPSDIYDRPANKFVAGFFGVPPMNLLTGHIRREAETVFVECAGACISLPPSLQSLAANRIGDTITVGIRPHDLSLAPPTEQKDNVLPGRVDLIEPLGSRTDVHMKLRTGEHCIVSCPPSEKLQAGEEVRVYVSPDTIHLFDPDDVGLRLTPTVAQQA